MLEEFSGSGSIYAGGISRRHSRLRPFIRTGKEGESSRNKKEFAVVCWQDGVKMLNKVVPQSTLGLTDLEEATLGAHQPQLMTPTDSMEEVQSSNNVDGVPPGLSLWRETLLKCTNAAQVFMCIQRLENSIAWEKSVLKVLCQICRKGNRDDLLLLCDICEQGCHTFCLKPKIEEIPEDDWFCPICISKANRQSARPTLSRNKIKQRRDRKHLARKANSHSAEPGSFLTKGRQRRYRKRTQNKISNAKGVEYSAVKRRNKKRSNSLSPGNAPAAKKRKISAKSDPKDLALCEVILMEMESHEDAWPFLHPVNPRMVPGYRKVIKKPMDFSTIRGKLIERKYTSCKEFAADAHLVFDNCLNFNENSSEIGQAGNVMRKFFESRWAEFYHSS